MRHLAITNRRLIMTAAPLLLASSWIAACGAPPAKESLDPARVAEIEAWLPARPEGLGRPIADRAWWDALRALPSFQWAIDDAKEELSRPLPKQTDELYLEFSKTGNRTHWQNVAFDRRQRLSWLTLAECLENQGRFLPAIEQLIADICAERTWVMPAHDQSLANFEGKTVDIDLASSALGWELATLDWLLGERLKPETRKTIAENVRRRVLDPFRAMATGQRPPNWWLRTTNNWNAVCLAGVTGAAMAQAEDRHERAEFIAATNKYISNFLAGFTPDGYCSEGLGYWNYGFGNFALLSETIRQATSARLDLLARPEARQPAQFGARIGVIGGVAPAFADCSVNAKPQPDIVAIIDRRLGLNLPPEARIDIRQPSKSLAATMIVVQAELDAPRPDKSVDAPKPELRTWFGSAGILIGRPAPDSACLMGVALKGGNNAEHHNHNDLGSYVVVLKDRAVLLDPGAETYTARTFSPQRYESKLLNSFGHPVPVVAGELQSEGAKAQARVIETHFSDEADSLKLDLSSAYPVRRLAKLERAFVYDRTGEGSLTITDRVAFTSPKSFGTALITRGEWKRLDGRRLRITDGAAAIDVAIGTDGVDFTIDAETINEDAPVHPTRIGLNLAHPVNEARIILTITPAKSGG